MSQKKFFSPIWLLSVPRCIGRLRRPWNALSFWGCWLFKMVIVIPVMTMVIGMAIISGFSLEKTVGLAILIAKAQPLDLSNTTRQAFILKTPEQYANNASQVDADGRPYPPLLAYKPADAAQIQEMDHDEDVAIEAGEPIAEILRGIYLALAVFSFCVCMPLSNRSNE